MYCGTYANQQALYMALHSHAEKNGFNLNQKGLAGFSSPDRLAVLASSDAHFSLKHGVRFLGLGDQSLVPVPVDKNRRLDVSSLEKTLKDLKDRKDIFCVVATAGTTSTGSVDPILPIAKLCADYDIWLHVDGAYGLAYSLVPEWKPLYTGLEMADSVSWDPHKQMRVPIPSSLLFVRRKDDFRRLTVHGDYFNREEDSAPNPGLKSPPTTRPLTALSLAATLRFQGKARVIRMLRSPLQVIKDAAGRLEGEKDIELGHTPDTGILCLRIRPSGLSEEHLDDLQSQVYQQILGEGKRTISITRIDNATFLRFVIISPSVTVGSVMETLSAVRKIAQEYMRT
jgi:L-2,4-diaminobutyrate decarboxylase